MLMYSTKMAVSDSLYKTVNFAVTSAACAATWAGLTAALNDFYCWTVDVNGLGLQWINDALRIALLLVSAPLKPSFVRLLNIN